MSSAFAFAILFAFIIALGLGRKRKIGFGWSLAACLLLSPLLGLIITLCSGKLPEKEDVKTEVSTTIDSTTTDSTTTEE